MNDRVTLSEWKLMSCGFEQEQRAEGPGGTFRALLSGGRRPWTRESSATVYEGSDVIAEVRGCSRADVEARTARVLTALAGQPTDVELRALDAMRGLPEGHSLTMHTGHLSPKEIATIREFIAAREALLAASEEGKA